MYFQSKSCKPDLPDIWVYLDMNRSCLQNLYYSESTQDEVLMPPLSYIMRNVEVWSDYFYRWSSFESFSNITDKLRPHLYDEVGM